MFGRGHYPSMYASVLHSVSLTHQFSKPAYVPPQSDQVWTQWMAPHFLSGGLAGFTYSALLYSSTLMHTFIGKHVWCT